MTNNERVFALEQLVSGLPRPAVEYLRANVRRPNNRGLHDTKIKGNLGRLFVTGNEDFNCNNWIAGSPNAHSVARAPIQLQESNDVYIGSLPDSGALYFATKASEAHVFPESFSPGRCDAREDSEYLFLNALGYALAKHQVIRGVAYLLTERVPCDSCTHVINQFLSAYPEFKLEVFYLFDSARRSHVAFLEDCKHSSQISMFFCQLMPTVSFVKIEAETPITTFTGDFSAAIESGVPVHVLSRIAPSNK